MTATILAVDGGNSKADVALVADDGRLLSVIRGPTVSHQVIGAKDGIARLARLAAIAVERAGLASDAPPDIGVYCLAGADFPSDLRQLHSELARQQLAAQQVVLNDSFGALRAGTSRPWGIVLICGQGINGAGVAPDGRTARFAGIGPLSGDWGGAGGLGSAALAAAIRARDGRGPRTSLEQAVAAHFGRRTPEAVMLAMYEGRIASRRLSELSPVVFDHAATRDAVARGIVDRLADELVAMAAALLRRLRLRRADVEVVLAGGVFAATEPHFYRRLEDGIHAVAPRATIVRPTVSPVCGAALIGLDRLSPGGVATAEASLRLCSAFEGLTPTTVDPEGV